ncbi:hypothetical protein KKF34_02165 [Myxococcota bacterium]|nr:hypothetical protein [Myxococcota bacterium]MBU1381450.1 hypothetical protein [Myxococcota bacterium]MBU1495666.1 hypothetical protein [Myxococcota bacterium]
MLVASFPALRFRFALSRVVYNMIRGFRVKSGFTGVIIQGDVITPAPSRLLRTGLISLRLWAQAHDPFIQHRMRIHGGDHLRLCDYPGPMVIHVYVITPAPTRDLRCLPASLIPSLIC